MAKEIEARNKFGVEMLPSLHKKLREAALSRDRKIYEVLQDAIESYLKLEPNEPRRRIPKALRPYMEILAEVLESGDDEAIQIATAAIRFSRARLRPVERE